MNKKVSRWMLCLAVVLGGVLGMVAYQDWRREDGKKITVTEFSSLPGASLNTRYHVSFDHFDETYVFEREDNTWGQGRVPSTNANPEVFATATPSPWKRVWILIHDDWIFSKQPVLVRSTGMKTPAEIDRLVRKREVTGIITTDARSLTSAERRELEKYFGRINDTVLIVEHEVPVLLTTNPMLVTGAAVVSLACAFLARMCLIMAKRRKQRVEARGNGADDPMSQLRTS